MAKVSILFVQCNIFREQQKHKLPCLLHEAPRGLRFIDDKKNPHVRATSQYLTRMILLPI